MERNYKRIPDFINQFQPQVVFGSAVILLRFYKL